MQWIMTIFGYPLGYIMWICYLVVQNYGLALILFTILTRLLLYPLSLKQQKEQIKMAVFRPRLEEIQKKYGNNKEKYNEELQKLYTEEHYNPLSGCLPMLIQLPLLFGLIDVIYKPLTHILHFSNDVIEQATAIATGAGIELGLYSPQIVLMNAVQNDPSKFSSMGAEFVEKVTEFDMMFLGMDFSLVPWDVITADGGFHWTLLMLIPILSGVGSLAYSLITMKSTAAQTGEGAAAANSMTRGMMLMMPLMSVYIAFIVPAGVGFYWLVSNLLMMVQHLYLNKKYNPQEMAEKMIAEQEAKRKELREEKKAARKKIAEGSADEADRQKALSAKEINRRKLAEARRRDAEKYGEEYVEVTDDDLR